MSGGGSVTNTNAAAAANANANVSYREKKVSRRIQEQVVTPSNRLPRQEK